ncbi:hypothetical protein SCACP_17780 [Sporomusa carbonis]|uniref:hypothetical protein n=1 Tax=Sporomusa carbonis TaxID=3076075 RepID=UPI003A6909AB
MLPIQFAIELETALNKQIELVSDTVQAEFTPLITLISGFQRQFLQLLSDASTVNIDREQYPAVNQDRLLGPDVAWRQFTGQNTSIIETNTQTITAIWSIYALIDRSAQYYLQAATNSAHPATGLFFHSLSQIKKILKGRLAGVIQMLYNHYWGKLGFAPFVLGKD